VLRAIEHDCEVAVSVTDKFDAQVRKIYEDWANDPAKSDESVLYSNIAAANPATVLKLLDMVREMRGALKYSNGALAALLENDEIECRGDEDCDHCVAVASQKDIEVFLARFPEGEL
jgi:hypothetical protein